jgi:hypothetical protein
MDKARITKLANDNPKMRAKLVPFLKKAAQPGSYEDNGRELKSKDFGLALNLMNQTANHLVQRLLQSIHTDGLKKETSPIGWVLEFTLARKDGAPQNFTVWLPLEMFRHFYRGNLKGRISVRAPQKAYDIPSLEDVLNDLGPKDLGDFIFDKIMMLLNKGM